MQKEPAHNAQEHNLVMMDWRALWSRIAQLANQDKANHHAQNAKQEMKFWMKNVAFAMEQHTAGKEQSVKSFQTVLQETKDRAFQVAHSVKLAMDWKKENAQFAMERHTAAKEQDVISFQIALQEMKDRAFQVVHSVKLDTNW